MNFFKTRNAQARQNSNHLLLPRLSINQADLPSNLQRAVSLKSINLPKLSSRADISNVSPRLSSPVLISKEIIASVSSPMLKFPTFPNLSASVKSNKSHGIVQLYCANTNKGLIRDYNEDRVMIMLRIPKNTERLGEK